MELTILGSGTCVPSLKRGSPGLLLKVNNKYIILDFGAGGLRRLLEIGVTYHDIDYCCFTHTHPDHMADLLPFLFCCNYGETFRTKDLQIIGGPGFPVFLNDFTSVFGHWLKPLEYKRNICELTNDRFEAGGFSIITRTVEHSPESVGYRIETPEGKSCSGWPR